MLMVSIHYYNNNVLNKLFVLFTTAFIRSLDLHNVDYKEGCWLYNTATIGVSL